MTSFSQENVFFICVEHPVEEWLFSVGQKQLLFNLLQVSQKVKSLKEPSESKQAADSLPGWIRETIKRGWLRLLRFQSRLSSLSAPKRLTFENKRAAWRCGSRTSVRQAAALVPLTQTLTCTSTPLGRWVSKPSPIAGFSFCSTVCYGAKMRPIFFETQRK